MKPEDNRRSFRVSESVYVKYDVLSEEDFEAGIEHRNLRLGLSDGAQAFQRAVGAKYPVV